MAFDPQEVFRFHSYIKPPQGQPSPAVPRSSSAQALPPSTPGSGRVHALSPSPRAWCSEGNGPTPLAAEARSSSNRHLTPQRARQANGQAPQAALLSPMRAPSPSAASGARSPLAASPGPVSFGPGGRRTPVENEQVDYHSSTYKTWIPAIVVHVDPETGSVKLNLKQYPLSLQDAQTLLRPRTKPEKARLEWTRSVLREGRIDQEAQEVFKRHATVEQDSEGVPMPPRIRRKAFHALGAELDVLLGVSGSVVQLSSEAEQMENKEFLLEGFVGVFWGLLSSVQHEYGIALPRKEGMHRRENPQKVYEFKKTLGQGTYGHVKLAQELKSHGKRAVKIINKDRMVTAMDQLQMEIDHLCLLDHPNIVKLYEYYTDEKHVYLVTDYCSGGELHEAIYKRSCTGNKFSEVYVAHIMRQVLRATAHIHARGIVHMDIKSANIMLMPSKGTLMPVFAPENETLEQEHARPHVVLIDLGVAQLFQPGNFKYNRPMGTPATMAPEVWRGVITPKADIYSCGVVLFELLSFHYPLHVPGDREQGARFWSNPPKIDFKKLQPASQDAEKLCRCMMTLDRIQRPSDAQCLRFPFLQMSLEEESALLEGSEAHAAPKVDPEIIRRITKLPERSVLYKSIALNIARVWPPNQMPTIKRAFQELSSTSTGNLDTTQVCSFLRSLGVTGSCAQKAADAMDLNRDGTVDWTEFVAACTYLGGENFESILWEIFQEADSDDDNLLSQSDVGKLLPLDHEGDVVQDVFHGLTGRVEPGARVDWDTFRRHFKSQTLRLEGSDGEEGAVPFASPPQQMLRQALDFVEKVRQGVFAAVTPTSGGQALTPAPRRTEVQEEDIQRLAEMGFPNREQCVAVLQRHDNELSNSAVEELVRLS